MPGSRTARVIAGHPRARRKELALQITLGPALFSTRDWTAPDIEAVYTRATSCAVSWENRRLSSRRYGEYVSSASCAGKSRRG